MLLRSEAGREGGKRRKFRVQGSLGQSFNTGKSTWHLEEKHFARRDFPMAMNLEYVNESNFVIWKLLFSGREGPALLIFGCCTHLPFSACCFP